MISIRNLDAGYGSVSVLRDVSMEIGEGEIVAVLGSNGVGKTTLNNTLSGLIRPSAGEVTFEGSVISGCLLYTSPSPRDATLSRMPSSA